MRLWSQLARLGAAAAALAPAVAEADDEPDQVEIPTLDSNNQPVAAATIGSDVDPDANLIEDMQVQTKFPVADVPAGPRLPSAADDRAPDPRRTLADPKPHVKVMPHGKSWHGGGQRYGG